MAKSAGNVVTPDSVAERYGADALRVYLLFMAPFENSTVWEEEGINGARRFLERTWRLVDEAVPGDSRRPTGQRLPAANPEAKPTRELERTLHRTIRRVTEDIEGLRFNTAIAALMECLNDLAEPIGRQHGLTPELAGGDPGLHPAAGALRALHRRRAVGAPGRSRTVYTGSPGPPGIRRWPPRRRVRWSCRSTGG